MTRSVYDGRIDINVKSKEIVSLIKLRVWTLDDLSQRNPSNCGITL